MSRKNVMENVKLSKFEDLFHNDEIVKSDNEVVQIPLEQLHDFKNHPFKIRSDEELAELIGSIRENGVIEPGIVRKRIDGEYEIVSGHTRCYVSGLLGLKTMPVLIKDINDDVAIIMMVDSNIKRENIYPSEKARAYKMKYDAMKNQGKAGNSLKEMEQENGENYKTIQRYIWLARLNDELLELVDTKKLGMGQGVSLSFLNNEQQEIVLKFIVEFNIKLSIAQAEHIKELARSGEISKEILVEYLLNKRESKKNNKGLTLKKQWLDQFFDDNYSEKQMMDVIRELLIDWKEGNYE